MSVYWIWLTQLKYIGPVLQKRLVTELGSAEAVYFASQAQLKQIPQINKRALQSIISSRSLTAADKILKQCDKKGIGILRYIDALYPAYAKNIKDSPVVLYYKGQLNNISTAVGVVGARRCTPYGRKVAEELGKELARCNTPLISGFAKGIDSYAQAACINQGGYTVIFLAGGVDICYPPEQRSLYDKTLANGGVYLSQYPPGTQPQPTHFLQRNALISAWSTELVVVEAGEKSGALWTADFAKKQSKPIYAVPHPIHTTEGTGCNLLLARGAIPFLGIKSLSSVRSCDDRVFTPPLKEQDPIIKILESSPASIATLKEKLLAEESIIMDRLLALELDGLIIIRGSIVSLL